MEFILKGSIGSSSWEGYGHKFPREFRGKTLTEALNKIYKVASYSPCEKRNMLSINTDNLYIIWCEDNYGGAGSIDEIIVVKDNGEKVRIFDYKNYASPKCLNELKEYEKYLRTIPNAISNGEY